MTPALPPVPGRRYAIGDIQGCLAPLQALLKRLGFDPARDRVVLVGDLVNRGPDSVGVLRFVRSLGPAAVALLGNHDLHALAAARAGRLNRKDTLGELFSAPDRAALLDGLRHCPLAVRESCGTLLVHAGVPPDWTVEETLAHAAEVQAVLQGPAPGRLLDALYGNEPARWSASLTGLERWRYIVNALTRQRCVDAQGALDFRHKGPPQTAPEGLMPWFAHPRRRSRGTRIVFGHWSLLGRVAWPEENVFGLDTGGVWGGGLTAMDLDSGELTHQPWPAACEPGAD